MSLKKTALHSEHLKLGARMVDFGGFDMPVQYNGIRQEHTAVREAAGLFDVSHMGEFMIEGPQALNLIQKVTINDASKLEPGKAQYSAMCYEDGGIVDDLLVYMLEDQKYMLVVNAANIEKDFEWISKQNSMKAELTNISDSMALLALQGPKSSEILKKLTDTAIDEIKFYRFELGTVAAEANIIISATGYTGEKGYELYIDSEQADAAKIWQEIMSAGEEFGLEPAGLGARDTLRLEMGFALYGNDITRDTTPLEARMGWLTKLDKENFIGKEALLKQKESGVERKLFGFTIDQKGKIPRQGYDIVDESGEKVGFVTSGTQSISLGKAIGMGYMPVSKAKENQNILIDIRKKRVEAATAKPPFLNK